jgi:uncharacterized membrane protein YsdA (DUF1294 family)
MGNYSTELMLNVERGTCMKSLGQDVRFYGALLHTGFYLLFIAFILTSYANIYERCAASISPSCLSSWTSPNAAASLNWRWLKSQLRVIERDCKLTSDKVGDAFLGKVLIASNLLALAIVALDKHQALNGGYRVCELLLLLCFNASGFVLGWPALFLLNHKIKKPTFLFMAVLVSLFSFVWPYLYFILK